MEKQQIRRSPAPPPPTPPQTGFKKDNVMKVGGRLLETIWSEHTKNGNPQTDNGSRKFKWPY